MLRSFSGPADRQALIDLVNARPAERLDDYPGLVDLRELLEIDLFRAHTCLVGEAGKPAQGFAILARYEDFTNLIVEAGVQDRDCLEALLLDWGLQRARQVGVYAAGPVQMDCRADDPIRMALLEGRGFIRQAWEGLHLRRSLRVPIPAPCLPEGFTLRPLEGEGEVEALVELHRAAWDTQNMTVEYRLAMMRAPTYEADLDLVAAAPDGRLAGYCTCYIDQEGNILTGRKDGYTDPIAVHPAFQRRGLAQALLCEGLRRLQARGMETARLGTGSDNLPMQRAACAVGFEVGSKTLKYELALGQEV